MTRILFICAKNRLRSPTAEHLFSTYPGVEADSAGVNHDAEVRVSAEQIDWADVIAVMERRHATKLRELFSSRLTGKRVYCLAIPDQYGYMEDRLISLLEARAVRFLP